MGAWLQDEKVLELLKIHSKKKLGAFFFLVVVSVGVFCFLLLEVVGLLFFVFEAGGRV